MKIIKLDAVKLFANLKHKHHVVSYALIAYSYLCSEINISHCTQSHYHGFWQCDSLLIILRGVIGPERNVRVNDGEDSSAITQTCGTNNPVS